MKQQTTARMFVTFIFVLLLSSVVASAQDFNPTNYPGTNPANVAQNLVITESKLLSGFESFLRSLFSPQTVYLKDSLGINKGSFKQGETMKVQSYQTLWESCSAAYLITEVYNAPVGQHTAGPNGECPYAGKTCVETYSKSLGSIAPSSVFSTSYSYTFPTSAKIGTWSVSSYVYCPSKNPRPVKYTGQTGGGYSSVDEIDFSVVQFLPVMPVCGNSVIEGTELCDKNKITSSSGGYLGYKECNAQCSGYSSFVGTEFCGDTIVQTSAGEQCDAGSSGSASCTTSCKITNVPPPPGTKYKCSSNQCVASTDGTYTESSCGGTCAAVPPPPGPTPPDSTSAPNFDVQIINAPSQVDSQQANIPIVVKVTNLNDRQDTMFVEAGIYDSTYVSTFQTQAIVNPDVQNCKAYETNVDTAQVTLGPKESKEITLTVRAPLVCSLTGSGSLNTNYGYVAATYVSCFTGGDTGSGGKDASTGVVAIKQEFGISCSGTCTDGIQNSDESDTDVGGRCVDEGRAAPLDYKCNANSDCKTGLVCLAVGGVSKTTPICRPASEEVSVRNVCPDPSGTDVNGVAACIPDSCPYVAGETHILGVYNTKVSPVCCTGATKQQSSISDISLRFPGLVVGATGGLIGGTSTGGPIGGAVGAAGVGAAGYFIGKYTYTNIDSTGICQSSGAAGFGEICQLNFLEGLGLNCIAGIAAELVALFILLKIFGGK